MSRLTRRRAAALAGAVTLSGGLAVAGLAASANAAPLPAPQHHAVCGLRGANIIQLTDGGVTYSYAAKFTLTPSGQEGGWLRDGYEPKPLLLPVHGVAFKAGPACDIVFSVPYPATGPDAGAQGVRTFSGTVIKGHLEGDVSETGTEDLVTTFSAVFPV